MELVDWQRIASNGLIHPWWVHRFLDELETWDLKDKNWLEFGSGYGTAWLRSKCKWVDSIEANPEWEIKVREYCNKNSLFNGIIYCEQLNEGDENTRDRYFKLIPDEKYDIISVDGIHRDECLKLALNHFKGRPGILIADNWQQDYVWISEQAEKTMEPYNINKFVQPDHFNNAGRPWCTVYWEIPK